MSGATAPVLAHPGNRSCIALPSAIHGSRLGVARSAIA